LLTVELNVNQLIKVGKPSGDPNCPEYINRAFEVERLLNTHAGTRDLNDMDLAESVSNFNPLLDDHEAPIELSSGDEKVTMYAVKGNHQPEPHARQRRMLGSELARQLSKSLDPSALQQREAVRTEQNLATVQLIAANQQIRDANQQIRDANNIIHELRSEITQLHNCLHISEAARYHAEFKLELTADVFPLSKARRNRKRHTIHAPEVISLLDSDDEPAPKVETQANLKVEEKSGDTVLPLAEFA
jgi:hypothetical protein